MTPRIRGIIARMVIALVAGLVEIAVLRFLKVEHGDNAL